MPFEISGGGLGEKLFGTRVPQLQFTVLIGRAHPHANGRTERLDIRRRGSGIVADRKPWVHCPPGFLPKQSRTSRWLQLVALTGRFFGLLLYLTY
jgi:hypothetical protein